MKIPRSLQVALWALAAALAVLALATVLRWGFEKERRVRSSFLMGDPREGARLFSAKGCRSCHPLFGQGGGTAPDLGKIPPRHATLNELVSEMWNHAPRMWASLREKQVEYVHIRSQEMADIFAFLYTIRYVEQPGDVDRGNRLFREKDCSRCHAVQGSGGKEGPDIAMPSFADTPVSWVRALWNHIALPAPGNQLAFSAAARLEGNDVADLLAFVRSVGKGSRQQSKLFPANLDQGAQVIKRKGCADCHAPGLAGRTARPWPPAGGLWPRSLPELAGVMWNHEPQVRPFRQANPQLDLRLGDQEAADLVAHLYSLRSLDPPGDPARGRTVYERKNCVVCHEPDAAGARQAPNLRRLKGRLTPIYLAETLWRHGPKIYEQMAKRGISWPAMETNEMNDLLAFLNSD